MKKRILFLQLCAVGVGLPAWAQINYAIPWFTIGGGGGVMSGGTYYLNATVGQPNAGGPMGGGGYAVYGGFWAYVLETPGAPPLSILRSPNAVTVYWLNLPGWSLYQNSNLSTPTNWTASSGVTSANGTNYLTVMPPTAQVFFRLEFR